MLKLWRQSPLVRFLLCFACGVLLQVNLSIPILLSASLLLFLLIILLYRHFIVTVIRYRLRHLNGLLISALFITLGCIGTYSKNPALQRNYYVHHLRANSTMLVKLLEAPVEKSKSYKIETEVLAISDSGSTIITQGKLLLYIKKDSLSALLQADDEVVISSTAQTIPDPKNPFEFDYKKYLSYHFIFRQAYAGDGQWTFAHGEPSRTLRGLLIQLREYLLKKLKPHIEDDRVYAVMSALILGKSDALDFELMSSYSSAGAIHVLAVSGLHVGLIYSLLSALLTGLFGKKRWRIIRTVVPLIVLWMYAGITGLSPSVMRSTLMFSCIVVAGNWSKTSNIYNTMAFSALVLLIINPYIIMEVGFQLSYLAVLGIVLLQKKIYALLYVPNKWIDKVWQLTSVSLAAQIATFPLGMLYFHQFPNYFLVSNLFVIPLATCILYSGLAFYLLSWIPVIPDYIIKLSTLLTSWMNALVSWFDRLPYSLLQGISITVFECYLVFALVFFICRWLFWRKPRALLGALLAGCILSILQIQEKKKILESSELCIHHIPRHRCITYAVGEVGYILYTGQLLQNESQVRFHLKNYWDHLGIKDIIHVNLDSTKRYDDKHLLVSKGQVITSNAQIIFADKNTLTDTLLPQEAYLYLGSELSGLYLDTIQTKYLKERRVILSDELSRKKKSWIEHHVCAGQNCLDLSNGAILIKGQTVGHFSATY